MIGVGEAEGRHAVLYGILEGCVGEWANACVKWPNVRLRVNYNAFALTYPFIYNLNKRFVCMHVIRQGNSAERRGQLAKHRHGHVVWVDNNIFVLCAVYLLWQKSIANILCMISVQEISALLIRLYNLLVFDLVVEFQLYKEKCNGIENNPIPKNASELFEKRGVVIHIAFVNNSWRNLRKRKFVIQFIGIINNPALIQANLRKPPTNRNRGCNLSYIIYYLRKFVKRNLS